MPNLQQPAIQATFIAKRLSVPDDQENSMKLPSATVAASLVCLIVAPVFAQTPPAASPAAPTSTVPVPATKRVTCLATTASLKGQDKRDQLQLCMAQARLDCLKQAIDQKVVGESQEERDQDLCGCGWSRAAIAERRHELALVGWAKRRVPTLSIAVIERW
ncbi:hypothetical protein [Bradyrhizobium ottawaense]|uniref:hypothetical protein n=1 Tax=Bradyrhizobium ottawaense TaxID=931866 RepID=UPI0035121999